MRFPRIAITFESVRTDRVRRHDRHDPTQVLLSGEFDDNAALRPAEFETDPRVEGVRQRHRKILESGYDAFRRGIAAARRPASPLAASVRGGFGDTIV